MNEGSFLINNGIPKALSDVEIFCVFKKPEAVKYITKIKQEICRQLPDYDWDISGNTFKEILKYSPRQWLIDGALTGQLLFKQNFFVASPFQKFADFQNAVIPQPVDGF